VTSGERETVCVLGNGGFGTALALVALANGHDVRLWGIDAAYVAETAKTRANPRYLPGVALPQALLLTSDDAAAARGATLLVSAVPTQFLRATMTRLAQHLPAGVPVVSVSKGVENATLLRPSQVIAETLGARAVAVLSGPSHAEEVARGAPTSVVVASADTKLAALVQRALGNERLRIYASDDALGVELAAATKNVVAIAAGAADGLGFGDNGKAGLLTRGLAEMTRLGIAAGANPLTFAGLAGMGDLIATCGSQLSRNHRLGEELAKGRSWTEIEASLPGVAEGAYTVRAALALADRHGVEMPIAREVERALFEGKSVQRCLVDLLARESKDELADFGRWMARLEEGGEAGPG
jgi:glycerol-3-phosphate dehydrogenase (NAD(P)+)